MSPKVKRLVAVIVPVQLVVATLAYRDLSRRPAAAVRGPKWLWRLLVPLNLGNAVAYWVVGRRSAPPVD